MDGGRYANTYITRGREESVPRLGSHAVKSSSPFGYFVWEFLNVQNNDRIDHFYQIPTTPNIVPQNLYLFIYEYV